MPHKCTTCQQIFDNGSSSILTGCPTCGGNKFLYVRGDRSERLKSEAPSERDTPRSADELLEKRTVTPAPAKGGNADPARVESIRILGPGSYEINIPALIERKEIVMALKEDGNYVIHMPSAFNKKRAKTRPNEKEK